MSKTKTHNKESKMETLEAAIQESIANVGEFIIKKMKLITETSEKDKTQLTLGDLETLGSIEVASNRLRKLFDIQDTFRKL
jgi:hypothetical protein